MCSAGPTHNQRYPVCSGLLRISTSAKMIFRDMRVIFNAETDPLAFANSCLYGWFSTPLYVV